MRGIPCDAYEGWLSEMKKKQEAILMHDDKHNHGPRTIVPLSCDKTTIMTESSKCGVKAALTKNIQEDHVSFAWNANEHTLCADVDTKSSVLLVFGMNNSLANATYDAQFVIQHVQA
jgi:uncharacterized protein YifN (PemK superfamily)